MASEFERISRFLAPFAPDGAGVVAGPGDDCALTRPRPGRLLVTKVDQVVEGVHFTSAFRPADIGHKALAVALSDLAAAGAEPRWFLVAVAMPAAYRDRDLDDLAAGMAALAREAGIALVGGNFTSAERLSLAVTTVGEVRPEHAIRRSGGSPGDVLLVTGTLGDAALGVRQLAGGRPRRPGRPALAQLRPVPRNAFGAGAGRWVTAGVDVSDGLLADLGHLVERSGVGAEVHLGSIPLSPEVRALGPEGLRLALTGGEDYELLFAAPPAGARALERRAAARGLALTRIGHLVPGAGIRLLDSDGTEVPPPTTRGWDHFSRGA
jgi:thiamine-monophosphate kinase